MMDKIEIQFEGTFDNLWEYVKRFIESYKWPESITFNQAPKKERGKTTITIVAVRSMTDAERDEYNIQHVGGMTFRHGRPVGRLEIFKVTEAQSALIGRYKTVTAKNFITSLVTKIIDDGLIPEPSQYPPKGKEREAGPTVKMTTRFEVFKELKTEHPEWTQNKVADEASITLGEIVTADSVRNTYRSMGEKWQRGDRIR